MYDMLIVKDIIQQKFIFKTCIELRLRNVQFSNNVANG